MKLDLFNPWRDLTGMGGRTLQYQTSKKGGAFTTYVRDKATKSPITFGLSRSSAEESQQRALDSVKKIGMDGVKKAIETGQMVRPSQEIAPSQDQKDIQWHDGTHHSSRAQKKIVQ